MSPADLILSIVKLTAQNLADDPTHLRIEMKHLCENEYRITIYTEGKTMGQILGKQGRNINAIRTVSEGIAAKLRVKVRIDLNDPRSS